MHRCAGLLVLFVCAFPAALAVKCKVVADHSPSEAETAFLHADYDKAATLYRAQLQQNAADPSATAGLVRVLLRQQKTSEAMEAVQKALTSDPKSAVLLTARGDVEYRQGTPWLAGASADEAEKSDPCNARVHLLLATLSQLNSMYARASRELHTAYALDPGDPDIRSEWIETLPTAQRITELQAYLGSANGNSPEDIRRETAYLDRLKKRASEPHKSCHLASSSTSTEVPFIFLMEDATRVRAFGLDVKLNGHSSRLEIDTGASGLLISRSVAERAGLKPFAEEEEGGIGSEGSKKGYSAYADTVQIGSLEFHDCAVSVLDSRNVVHSEGLIGMDVFAQFLVTLDYPMRRLLLGPLPPRPDESVEAPSLATRGNAGDDVGGKESSPPAADSKTADASSLKPLVLHDRFVDPSMKDYYPVYRVGHQLLMPTGVNQGKPKLFIVDSGAWRTSISVDAAREAGALHRDQFMQIEGVSGRVDKAYFTGHMTLDFAGLRQPADELVGFDTSSISRSVGLEVSGFIGATTLRQVTTHIDYRDGLIRFDYDPTRGYKVKLGMPPE